MMTLTKHDIRQLALSDEDLRDLDRIKEAVRARYSVTISTTTAKRIRDERIRN